MVILTNAIIVYIEGIEYSYIDQRLSLKLTLYINSNRLVTLTQELTCIKINIQFKLIRYRLSYINLRLLLNNIKL